MRSTSWIPVLPLLVVLGNPVLGQNVPYTAAVTLPEAEVKARPGTESAVYVTNRLRQGQQVQVLKERDDGWLEIRPPAGSFSWVNARFVERVVPSQPNQPTWVVVAPPTTKVPVLIGSELLKSQPNIEGIRLQRGTQVRAIGAPKAGDDGTYLPIETPPAEVRYLRVEAIGKAAPGPKPAAPATTFNNPTVTARPASATGGSGSTFQATPAAGSALAPIIDVDALWQRAQQAEREGNTGEAIRLYTQIGNETVRTNQDRALEAYNRAFWLRDASRNPTASSFVANPAPPAAVPSAAPNASTVPPPAQVRLSPPETTAGVVPRPTDSLGVYSSGPGRLRRAGRSADNRKTYVLESARGLPTLYVTPAVGLDLEPFVNLNVDLIGPVVYQGALRANLMTVTRVQPLQ